LECDDAFTCNEAKTSSWEELTISPSEENQQASTKRKTQKKHIPLESDSNMPRCNVL